MDRLTWRQMIDIPPVWLALFLALAWLQSTRIAFRPLEHPFFDLFGGILVGGGILLTLLAFLQMRRARTTLIPHLEADALVTQGIYAKSRNPIYLGDAAILTGLVLYWGAWPSLVLVPLFVWVITDRFIRPEEARLQARFGPAWEAWAARTRRWL